MRKLIFTSLYIFALSNCLIAQRSLLYQKKFVDYSSYIFDKYSVRCSLPANFVDLNKYYELWVVQKNTHAGFFYGPILQSKDKECILMYPYNLIIVKNDNNEPEKSDSITPIIFNLNKSIKTEGLLLIESQIKFELGAAYGWLNKGGFQVIDSLDYDINKYVTIITGSKPKEMFNADKVFIYNLPLKEPYLEKYNFCTGIILNKENRASVIIKMFFNQRGKKNEYFYFNQLYKAFWFEE